MRWYVLPQNLFVLSHGARVVSFCGLMEIARRGRKVGSSPEAINLFFFFLILRTR